MVDRQEGPHAHFAALSPGGTHVLVADLGTDQVRRYRVGPDGLLSDPGVAALLPAGAGPRHLAVRGELIYAVCELDHTVRTLRWDAATLGLTGQQVVEILYNEAPRITVGGASGPRIYFRQGGPVVRWRG